MKDLKQYIEEKLIINKNFKAEINYEPNDTVELTKIILKKLDDLETQKTHVLDMSDIDINNIKNLADIFNVNMYQYKNAFNGINCMHILKNIKVINISGWDTSNVESFYATFKGCEQLEQIIGIEDLDFSKAHTISYMFYKCENIKSLNLSKWKVDKIKMLSHLFYECLRLEEIKGLEKWRLNPIGNLSFDSMFNKCEELKSIDISSWKVENVRDFDYMFRRCYELTSIGDISGWKPEHLDSMEGMFFSCTKLRNIGDIDIWSDIDYNRFNKSLYCLNAFKNCDKSIMPEWYKNNAAFNGFKI